MLLLTYIDSKIFLFSISTRAIYQNTVIPYHVYMQWETIWPITGVDLVSDSSGLNLLSADDRQALMRHNLPAFTIFLQAVVMENRQDFRSTNIGETIQNSLLRVPPTQTNQGDVQVLHDVLKSLNVGMRMPHNALTYDQVFASPWAPRHNFFLKS